MTLAFARVPVGLAPLEPLAALHRDIFARRPTRPLSAADWGDLIKLPTSHLFLALNNEVLVGFALFQIVAPEAELLTLGLKRDLQGSGCGRRFVGYCLGALNDYNINNAFLEVDELNTRAIDFYEKFGFQRVGRRDRYYKTPNGEPVAALLYQINLPLPGTRC